MFKSKLKNNNCRTIKSMTISKKVFYESWWVLKNYIASNQKVIYVFKFMFIFDFIYMKLSSNGIGYMGEEFFCPFEWGTEAGLPKWGFLIRRGWGGGCGGLSLLLVAIVVKSGGREWKWWWEEWGRKGRGGGSSICKWELEIVVLLAM